MHNCKREGVAQKKPLRSCHLCVAVVEPSCADDSNVNPPFWHMKDILMKFILAKGPHAKRSYERRSGVIGGGMMRSSAITNGAIANGAIACGGSPPPRANPACKRMHSHAEAPPRGEDNSSSIINYKMVLGLKRVEINNLSSMCRDFHNIFRIDKQQLVKYTNDILPFVRYLRTSEIVMILHHYAFICYHNVHFYDSVWSQAINRLHDIDCKELALIVYSMGKIKYTNKDMLSFFEKEIKKWATKFTGRDCSLILKGLKCLNYNNEEIYSLIYNRILAIADRLNILDICIILNTHSKSKNVNLNLFETLLDKSLTFYSVLNEQCIGSLLWSVSHANIKAEKYFALLGLRLRMLMHEKFVKEGKLPQKDPFEDDIPRGGKNSREDKPASESKNECPPKGDPQLGGTPASDDLHCEDSQTSRNGCIDDFNYDLFESNNGSDTANESSDLSDHMDNWNFRLSSHTLCKYENVIPSIIYSYGKQKTYMKHNIYVDRTLYNHILNSYSVEQSINSSPQESVYLFDLSRKILKDKHIFANSDGQKKNKLRKYHIKKYYQDIIYIVNNYLPFFLSNIHYNDLKNVLFGIAKIEMPVNKKLLNDIFELIARYVKSNLYKNYELINLARSLSLLPHVKADLWHCIIDCYKNNFIENTSVKNNCYMFYIFSFVSKGLASTKFQDFLILYIREKTAHLSKEDVIHIIKGLINLNYYHQELVKNVTNYVIKNYESFNLIDIVYILKYFTAMHLRNETIFSLFSLTIKKNNTRCNYALISTIAAFYLEMDITPKAIEDILLQEKMSRQKNFTTEEIHCDEE
ncbi:heptatricopeptide repeat-containing protein, putative [Plasmodium vivax]|uniref:Heptatricopeptide repeat-containing protein, putative n=1 Tax=Plasmodium vivax TaxID=5855 RepID=A0A564ZTA3_PLAVI|nr:heptatricopeptide repeat-containing protein, putative [Plasmodium vivax]